MKKILVSFFLLAGLSSCGSKKKVNFVDHDNKPISRLKVLSLSKRENFVKETENDTAVIKQILPHRIIGKLDSVQHGQLNMFLEKILRTKFDRNKKTMIHLYRKNDGQIQKDSEYRKYWKWIGSHSDDFQAFLIGTKFSEIKEDPGNNIYADPYDQLENLFFRESDFNLNHLLIKPDGTVYVFYGLDDILGVLDWSVD